MDMDRTIAERHSVRKYTARRIEGDVLRELSREIDRVNGESGLSVRLIMDEPRAFGGFALKGVMGFENAVNYLAVSGPESDHLELDAGYYGEHLVLFAQSIGLNTCWALMAKKGVASEGLPDGHRMVISISIGYGANQGVPHKSKPIEQFADVDGAPGWFVDGVRCAMLAPTGVNRQGFRFERDGTRVRLIGGSGTLGRIDTGIVRYHFEHGAGRENFTWTD